MTPDFALLILSIVGGAFSLPGIVGQCITYPWLGLFPGLALANILLPESGRATRYPVGIALSPVVTTVVAWALMRAGLSFDGAAVAVAASGWLGCGLSLRALRPQRESSQDLRGPLWLALALAVTLVLVPVLNPWLFVRSDSWIHGGIVMELVERGFPPEDARMAGLRLNYVWFFNYFIALLHSLHHRDIFRFMTLFNGANGFATVMLAALAARRLWRDPRAPLASGLLLVFGLNAGAFLLWPLIFVKAFTGEVRGFAEITRQCRQLEWNSVNVLYSLSAPFAGMVSFLDKLLVGTALSFAYLQMAVWLWALLEWLETPRARWLILLTASGVGMMLFHSVVGLSVLPIGLVVLGAAWALQPRWPWLPARRTLLLAGLATLAGLVVTLPYLRSIAAGWAPDKAGFRFQFVEFNREIPWTLATACAFVLWAMVEPLKASAREHRPLPLLLGAWGVLMAGFAIVVHLPQHNAVKFVYQCFVAFALLAVPRALEVARDHRARPRATTVVLLILWITPTFLTLFGYLVDPTGRQRRAELHPGPGEVRLYTWLRQETPRTAVVVDRNFRDVVAVRAARRLYLGTDQPPELAAFPAPEMRRRQEAMRDLYDRLASPDSTLARLSEIPAPVYVIYRPDDPITVAAPWNRLVAASPRAELVYDLDRFHVVRIRPRIPS